MPTILPPDVEDLRHRTRAFIRETVIPREPSPGERMPQEIRDQLQSLTQRAGVFAPQVPVEYGGQGLPIEHWSPIF
jgi:acyl-CoA dehydrogenase